MLSIDCAGLHACWQITGRYPSCWRSSRSSSPESLVSVCSPNVTIAAASGFHSTQDTEDACFDYTGLRLVAERHPTLSCGVSVSRKAAVRGSWSCFIHQASLSLQRSKINRWHGRTSLLLIIRCSFTMFSFLILLQGLPQSVLLLGSSHVLLDSQSIFLDAAVVASAVPIVPSAWGLVVPIFDARAAHAGWAGGGGGGPVRPRREPRATKRVLHARGQKPCMRCQQSSWASRFFSRWLSAPSRVRVLSFERAVGIAKSLGIPNIPADAEAVGSRLLCRTWQLLE